MSITKSKREGKTKMTNLVELMVKEIDPKNYEYIMADRHFEQIAGRYEIAMKGGKHQIANMIVGEIEKFIREYDERHLTPANVEVGLGATVCLYSDRFAGTIIKKTKTTITVQKDIATLKEDFKPKFEVGGFAGHCVNQDEQAYTYERNENGSTQVFRWSKKHNCYMNGSRRLIKGRKEYYDYNF